ncbi:MAG: extracellular solute-binding protein [Clostridiales bacterium]|jgi:ABC-type glycerol-3-phosphate transport system substrate-binding protein|nr:extracellular solute-binding protein [Clostridiales bacterium]
MKKKIMNMALSVVLVALFSACGATAQSADTAPAESLSGTLTLAQCYDFSNMADAVAKFKALHPDVTIELTTYANDTEKYSADLSANLMAGTAPDVFENDAYISDYTKLADTGMLADIKPFMDADPAFNDENYFMNVYQGMTYKGGLYLLPAVFGYDCVGINSALPADVTASFRERTAVSNRELMDIFLGLPKKEDFYLDMNFDVSVLVNSVINDYIDLENKTCNFNTPEFIQLVNDAKALTEPSEFFGGITSSSYIPPAIDAAHSKKYAFERFYSENYQYFLNYQEYLFKDFIPVTDNHGQLLLSPQKTFSINANAPNKQLAWEFVKFLTSKEANADIPVVGLPVKKEVYHQWLPESISQFVTMVKEDVAISPVGNLEELKAAAVEKLTGFAQLPMKYQFSPYYSMIFESLQQFNDGAVTAEQLANDLQNKISIALME